MSRQVDDLGTESLAEELKKLSVEVVEPFMREFRQEILNELKEKNAK